MSTAKGMCDFYQSQSPVVIGLISTLTDSASREDIEKTLWRLWERGQSILMQTSPAVARKRAKAKQNADIPS